MSVILLKIMFTYIGRKMYNYENKTDILVPIKKYIENVTEKPINDIDLNEINIFLNDLEDWYEIKT